MSGNALLVTLLVVYDYDEVQVMYSPELPVLAGIVSTVIFASSTLPMLIKALRTRDLGSYSLGNLTLANVGNAVHSVYVFSLPPGPLWALHSFHLGSTVFMLVWYLRFGLVRRRSAGSLEAELIDLERESALVCSRR